MPRLLQRLEDDAAAIAVACVLGGAEFQMVELLNWRRGS